IARKHLGWYAKDRPENAAFRQVVNRAETASEQWRLTRDYFAALAVGERLAACSCPCRAGRGASRTRCGTTAAHTAECTATLRQAERRRAAKTGAGMYHARLHLSFYPYEGIYTAMSNYLFTSESVSEGHPDKVADQISDAVLDAIIAQDPRARVACETMVKTGVAIVAGEITTNAWIDLEAITRKVIVDIGYDSSDVGFDGATCGVINLIGKQSPDINQGVDRKKPEDQGAGDQGLMFGYATNETKTFMPAAIHYSHRLVEQQAKVRKAKKSPLPWLRPDAKSQVTLRYENGVATAIDAVVLSTQHDPGVKQKDLIEAVRELILKPVLP